MSGVHLALRGLLVRCLSEQTMERIVDPVLADTAHERQALLTEGRHWRARWTAVAGASALMRALALQALWDAAVYEPEPRRRAGQARGIAAAAAVVTTVSLATVPFSAVFAHHRDDVAWLFLYLLPQALPTGLVAGLVAAALWTGGTRSGGERGPLWVAAAGTALTLVLMGWAIPSANQAFRVTVLAAPEVPRGLNELTLPELRGLAAGAPAPSDLLPTTTPAQAAAALHVRAALILAPLIMTWAALSVAGTVTGAFVRLALGAMALGTYVCWWFGLALAEAPVTHLVLWGWAPSAASLAGSILLRSRCRRAP